MTDTDRTEIEVVLVSTCHKPQRLHPPRSRPAFVPNLNIPLPRQQAGRFLTVVDHTTTIHLPIRSRGPRRSKTEPARKGWRFNPLQRIPNPGRSPGVSPVLATPQIRVTAARSTTSTARRSMRRQNSRRGRRGSGSPSASCSPRHSSRARSPRAASRTEHVLVGISVQRVPGGACGRMRVHGNIAQDAQRHPRSTLASSAPAAAGPLLPRCTPGECGGAGRDLKTRCHGGGRLCVRAGDGRALSRHQLATSRTGSER
jgi:hypothetical protein